MKTSIRSRRWFVTKFASRTALAGIGALTVGRLIGKDALSVQAADGDPVIIGQNNSGSSTTTIRSSPAGINSAALQGITTSPDGHGVTGFVDTTAPSTTTGLPIGVAGYTQSVSGVGVNGHAGATSGQTTGVVGHCNSPDGVGVFGLTDSTEPGTMIGKPVGVVGFTRSPTGRAVAGNAAAPTGLTIAVDGGSASPDGIGVRGYTSSTSPGSTRSRPIGVEGSSESPTGKGVFGHAGSETGVTVGVFGLAFSPDGFGVAAENLQGRALVVVGKAAFSTSGTGTIPVESSSAVVADSRIGGSSHITVTLTGDPGGHPRPAAVSWVERNPGVGFTVHLTTDATSETPFTYLATEPYLTG